MRPVNLHVTGRAVGILGVQIVLGAGRLQGADIVRDAVTGQTELVDGTKSQ